MTIHSDYGLVSPMYQGLILSEPGIPLFLGIECEIEDIKDATEIPCNLFHQTTDGSLRNNGYEFVSVPMTHPVAVDSFKKLHTTLVKGPAAFSQRTSIHVHANCSNLQHHEVRNIILTYALYEEAFFAMVDPVRRDNIHCVPLTETYLPGIYRRNLNQLIDRWHKYTALNIKPLTKYGTLEFRHMHGNDDAILFEEWTGTINNLFSTSLAGAPLETVNLTEEFLYEKFMRIFGHTRVAAKWPDIRSRMDNQIIDIKLIG